MSKNKKPVIFLPYDFTEVSKSAIKHGASLAKLFGYSITILNIYDKSTRMYLKMSNMNKSDLAFKLEEMCTFIKNNSGVDVDYVLRDGSINSIGILAKELEVSFMVLGIDEPKGGHSEIMKVVSKSPVPVFVVQQRSEESEYKHIFFPLDDFHGSRQKVGWAAHLAKTSNARISIFSITLTDKEKIYKHKKIIEQIEMFFEKHGISYSTHFAKGAIKDFSEEAIQFGVESKCDLFVIMHRPKKLFSSLDPIDKKFIFNSAKLPVMCVNLMDIGVAGGFN